MGLNLSHSAKDVWQKAEEFSREGKNFYLGVEHLFLALLYRESELIDALWDELQINRELFLEEFQRFFWPPLEGPPWKEGTLTPRLKKVMKLAEEEALLDKARWIEPRHLLLGLLKEGRGLVCEAFIRVGAEVESLYQYFKEGKALKAKVKSFDIREGPLSYKALVEPEKEKEELVGGGAVANEKAFKKSVLLDKLGVDLVALAKQGKLDQVVGRKEEITRMIQILSRRGKNNPVLIGEAGVGKTACVIGLAQRIAEGKVPQALLDKRIIEITPSSLVAGTKHRGEFEERLDKLLKELRSHPEVILFIDEIHTIVGAGDSAGSLDAANILKPALAKGDITVIGATTTDEYRKFIEQDSALERRFQPVYVNEPTEVEAVDILKGLRGKLEKHHKVVITDEAVLEAVKLSVRYIPERNLPDKAIDLLDETCSRVKLKLSGGDSAFGLEKKIIEGEVTVNKEDVAEVVSIWTEIPVSQLTLEESQKLLKIEEFLKERVIGQEEAIKLVAQTVRMARVGLQAAERPSGVFLFLGPTGVGKTQLAKALAEFLFGSEKDHLIRLDMSEFKESHSIAKLIGAPPGYIGYSDEGKFTKMVRSKPYSVVLLDEIEKAHPEVFDVFLQVFDEGRLTDAHGRIINFCNTIIIMTSNIGVDYEKLEEITKVGDSFSIREKLTAELIEYFRPEFLNRIDEIILFKPLSKEDLIRICELNLKALRNRLAEEHNLYLQVDESAIELLLEYGYDSKYGARPLRRTIERFLIKPLADEILKKNWKEGGRVLARAEEDRIKFEFTSYETAIKTTDN